MILVDANGKRREVAHDESPAIISDHPFVPRGEWWSLCGHEDCCLAEAAHAETTLTGDEHIHVRYYADDNPEIFEES